MAFPILLAMAAAKMIGDANKEKSDRNLAANTQRFSPWTGLQAGPIHEADPIGTGMQAYGAYQSDKQAGVDQATGQKLKEAQIGYLNRQGAQPSVGIDQPTYITPGLFDYADPEYNRKLMGRG